MKLALPPQSADFYAFCAKKSQVGIVYERGYTIPPDELIMFTTVVDSKFRPPNEKVQFEKFCDYYKPGHSKSVEYKSLDYDYIGDGLTKLKVRFCMGSELESRATGEITIEKNRKNRKKIKGLKKPTKIYNFLFITDGASELKVAFDSDVMFQILEFQKLYVDPRTHIYSSLNSLLTPEQKHKLLSTDSMKGLSPCQINSHTDPLCIFMGLSRGDVILQQQDSVYCDQAIAKVNYRIAT